MNRVQIAGGLVVYGPPGEYRDRSGAQEHWGRGGSDDREGDPGCSDDDEDSDPAEYDDTGIGDLDGLSEQMAGTRSAPGHVE